MSDSAKRKAAENHCDKVAPSISWSYTHRRVVEESFEAGWDAAIDADRTEIARLSKIEERAKDVAELPAGTGEYSPTRLRSEAAQYILEGGKDRDALIAQAARVCEARGHGGLWPCKENCIVCALADALASDAKALEELKALCDHIDKRYWKTPIMGAEPTIETSEIRALFGWNATTKDLHTQTTKGDT